MMMRRKEEDDEEEAPTNLHTNEHTVERRDKDRCKIDKCIEIDKMHTEILRASTITIYSKSNQSIINMEGVCTTSNLDCSLFLSCSF